MQTTQEYLNQYYLKHADFAALCEVTPAMLSQLIESGLVANPSYVVKDNSSIHTVVFGEIACADVVTGEYFHPAHSAWVRGAARLLESLGATRAQAQLKQQFCDEFGAALGELNASTFALADCFDESGGVIVAGIMKRCETAWMYFLNGTFGLCVADPSTIANIARKEILQEKLTVLSQNGQISDFSQEEAQALLRLIDDYAASSMPFSPAEYARSSRKRLVNDLRLRLINP